MEEHHLIIKGVYCPDSAYNEGIAHIVGRHEVTKIERRDENLGTYGIIWYDVYRGEVRIASINAMCIEAITYA